jgi:hypothetical protein
MRYTLADWRLTSAATPTELAGHLTFFYMKRTRIKICGFTRQQDVQAAVQLGADAIGLVFYPPSARYISPRQAAEIVQNLPPFVYVVG